jgi:hypothetical protein
MIRDAVELEAEYARETMPRGILGMNAGMFEEYLHFIANRRCQQIGLDEMFPGVTNPFPWNETRSKRIWSDHDVSVSTGCKVECVNRRAERDRPSVRTARRVAAGAAINNVTFQLFPQRKHRIDTCTAPKQPIKHRGDECEWNEAQLHGRSAAKPGG